MTAAPSARTQQLQSSFPGSSVRPLIISAAVRRGPFDP